MEMPVLKRKCNAIVCFIDFKNNDCKTEKNIFLVYFLIVSINSTLNNQNNVTY